MIINFSPHCMTQALDRDLLVELRSGISKIKDSDIDQNLTGEINFIVERKSQILRREGSTGDLVILGIEVDQWIVKSVFLQCESQVSYRESQGRVYVDLA